MDERTYLQTNLQNERLIRWIDNCIPLKFYIAPFRWYKAKEEGYQYIGLVHQALKAWTQASNGRIQFELVNNLQDSFMNLDWKRIDRKALGHCSFSFDNQSRLYSADIQIGLSDGIIHAKYMKKEEVYHTILHEIGHALGLGHSPYKTDIMYTPHQYGVVNLSPNDAASIIWLYRLPYNATLQDLVNKYKIHTDNIDDLIFKLSNNYQSDFEIVKNSIQEQKKDLLQEQTNIAELKKYNMLLQNIQISKNIGNYMQKLQIEKDNKNKK